MSKFVFIFFVIFFLLGIWNPDLSWRYLGLCTLLWGGWVIIKGHVGVGVEGFPALCNLRGKPAFVVGSLGAVLGILLIVDPGLLLGLIV